MWTGLYSHKHDYSIFLKYEDQKLIEHFQAYRTSLSPKIFFLKQEKKQLFLNPWMFKCPGIVEIYILVLLHGLLKPGRIYSRKEKAYVL